MALSDYTTAVVTGASSGIGAAIVRALCARGIVVTAMARRPGPLDKLAEETGCRTLTLDVRDRDALYAALDGNEIDILVNNAGIGRGMEGLLTAEPDDIDAVAETNLVSVLHALRAVAPGMVARRRGHIVNTGSIAGLYPLRAPLYGASKGGLHLLCQNMRVELVGSGVRITEICPGRVRTPFFRAAWDDEAKARSFTEGFALLEPEDIADAAIYALDAPAHVNVATIELMPIEQAAGGLIIKKLDEASVNTEIPGSQP